MKHSVMKLDHSNKFDLCWYGKVNLLRLKSNVFSKCVNTFGVNIILLAMVPLNSLQIIAPIKTKEAFKIILILDVNASIVSQKCSFQNQLLQKINLFFFSS